MTRLPSFLRAFGRNRSGAAAIQIAITAAVLIGMGGLVIDLGRAFTLQTELQQAADAAALAAAAELDGFSGARARATAAANAFINNQTYAAGGSAITLASIAFLRSIQQPTTVIPPDTAPADTVSSGDSDAFYVRVVTTQRSVTGLFINILTAANIVNATAVATATRLVVTCIDLPLMMCNPNEPGLPFGTGPNQLFTGQQIWITNPAAPGNFGFVCPPGSGNCGGQTLGQFLASFNALTPTGSQCLISGGNGSGLPTTKPGQTSGQVRNIDSRFGTGSSTTKPPSPDITNYPNDTNISANNALGNGIWNVNPNSAGSWWATDHPGITYPPSGLAMDGPNGTATRYDVYNWEIATNHIPTKPSPALSTDDPNRRLVNVAVINCQEQGIQGRSNFEANAAFKGFLTEDYWTAGNKNVYVEVVQPYDLNATNPKIHAVVELVR